MKLGHTRIVTIDVAALAKFCREVTGITPKILSEASLDNCAGGHVIDSRYRSHDCSGGRAHRGISMPNRPKKS